MFTEEQINALRYLIFRSKDINKTSKRIAAFLLEKSEGLTKRVHVTLKAGKCGYTRRQLYNAIFDGARSCLGQTHLTEIMTAMGSKFRFVTCSGGFNRKGKWDGCLRNKLTFRLGPEDRDIFMTEEFFVDRAMLEKVDIKRSGLYDNTLDED